MLVNPLPYGDGVLSDTVPPYPVVRFMDVKVDADMFIYQAGFSVEHNEVVVFDEDGGVRHQFKGVQPFNKWCKEWGYDPEVLEWDKFFSIEPVSHAIMKLKRKAQKINDVVDGARQEWFLTKGSTLVRNQDATIQRYKENRTKTEKPQYYDDLRQYTMTYLCAKIYEGIEADDIVASAQRADPHNVLVVGGDKDLRTVSGWHMNPRGKYELEWVSPLKACRNFYGQMLSGDRIDNIRGLSGTKDCPGIGVKTAEKMLMPYITERDMQLCVMREYKEKYPNGLTNLEGKHLEWYDIMVENANLLFLRDNPDIRFYWGQ